MIGEPRTMRDWRPQRFGRRPARKITDPLIEPVWSGIRVLVHVRDGSVNLVDEEGHEPAPIAAETIDALGAAVLAGEVILDGYLTTQVGSGVGVFAGSAMWPQASPGDIARQLLLGRPRAPRPELPADVDDSEGVLDPEADVVFVAVDLLMLEGQSLLDIPLLERKRLLDSVIDEGRLTRLGMHVRPPIGPWLATWRAAGFRTLAWKHANSRYRPGEANDEWALSGIPDRARGA